MSIVKQKILPT